MDFIGALRKALLSRGQENMKIKPKQKEALEEIAFNGWDCRIVLPTG